MTSWLRMLGLLLHGIPLTTIHQCQNEGSHMNLQVITMVQLMQGTIELKMVIT